MKYSLINVNKSGKTGYWLQDFVGTKEGAEILAKETEKANSYRIKVIVVKQIPNIVPILDLINI